MNSELTLEIDEHGLNASLIIPAHYTPQLEEISQLVADKGICFGLIASAIQEACAACNTEKRIVIAKGLSAQELSASPIQTDFDLEKETPVEAGQYIGYLTQQTPNANGMNVFGEKITAAKKNAFTCLGPGLEIRQHQIYATIDGILAVDGDGCWQIVDQEADQGVEINAITITTCPDYMRAYINLDKHEYVAPGTLSQEVQKQKISYGLRESGIRQAINARPLSREITITEGLYPKNGEPAYLEYLIDDKIHFQTKPDGSVDFKAGSLYKSVSAGTPLAMLHPATKGKAGMDIRGNKLEAKDGAEKDIEDFIDEGAAQSPDNPQLIIAAQDGIFNRAQSGKVGVLACLIINGNVDMGVGNIETPYPVIIKGDIKEGFNVKSGSDITVEGVIEDARVSANGNLIVNKGILPGKNRIKAQGDIAALYIREREIKARNLIVSKGIRRSIIHATGDISAQEILGGETYAANTVHVEELGSPSNHRTKVSVGLDPYLNALKKECQQRVSELFEKSKTLNTQVNSTSQRASELVKKFTLLREEKGQSASYLEQLRQQTKRAAEEHTRLSAEYRTALRDINTLNKDIENYDEQMREMVVHSSIEISGTVYAPCEVHIGQHAHYRIDGPISNLAFILNSKEEIQIVHHKGDADQPA